ncbi:MAG: hypothetical protein KJT03_16850, partial [Verrucomicrobiae bacterium]|nr:hypothetical protein [Verrucomicrobiae bacterium]
MRDFCLFLFSPFLALLFGLNSAVLQADTVDDVAETQANLVEVLKLQESRSNELRAWKELKELMQGQLELDRRTLEILEREL